jgi:hypothetical protein
VRGYDVEPDAAGGGSGRQVRGGGLSSLGVRAREEPTRLLADVDSSRRLERLERGPDEVIEQERAVPVRGAASADMSSTAALRAYTSSAKPEICRRLSGKTRRSQPSPRLTTQMTIVLRSSSATDDTSAHAGAPTCTYP